MKYEEDIHETSFRSKNPECQASFLEQHDPLHENCEADSLYRLNWNDVSC